MPVTFALSESVETEIREINHWQQAGGRARCLLSGSRLSFYGLSPRDSVG